MATPNDRLAAPTHGASHVELIRTIPTPPRRAVLPAHRPDAIVVSAARPAANLRTAAALAARLDAQLVVLCSRAASAAEAAEVTARVPRLRAVAVDVPDGYRHPWFSFATASVADAASSQLGDLSVKRNAGLVLARLLGWRSTLFLDDDIRAVRAAAVRAGVRALRSFAAVGMPVGRFPDNSVVCHANRLSGAEQGVFVSGSTLLANTARTRSFFPGVYNEDWLFLFDDVVARAVAATGSARQLRYAPFADARRAASEEFGDVLAEGLVALAHAGAPVQLASTRGYWDRFLDARRVFIAAAADRLAAPAPGVPRHARAAARRSLAAAEARRRQLDPTVLRDFVQLWRADLGVWRGRLARLGRVDGVRAALHVLDLVDPYAAGTPGPASIPLRAPRKDQLMTTSATTGPPTAPEPRTLPVIDMVVDPSSRISPTAHLGSPYRWLQNGEQYDRLNRPLTVGARCDIGPFCTVAEEAQIGDGTILDAYTLVEGGATVGRNVVVTHRASIGAKSVIEDDCVIAALVCERSHVGAGSRVFGDLIHRQLDPSLPWDDDAAQEDSPQLGENVFVGWGATVVGNVKIGRGTYVCAGATVTKNVDPGMIVTGVNKAVSRAEWHGPLAESKFFELP